MNPHSQLPPAPVGLAAARVPPAVFVRVVRQLYTMLAARFEREETVGEGLFSEICAAGPQYLGLVPTLRHEHREILSALNTLVTLSGDATGAAWDALMEDFRAVVEAVAAHEDLERAIIDDLNAACDAAE